MNDRIKKISYKKLFFTVLFAPYFSVFLLSFFILPIEPPLTKQIFFAVAGSFIAYPFMIVYGLPAILILESSKFPNAWIKYFIYLIGGCLPTLLIGVTSGTFFTSILTLPAGVICSVISAFMMNFSFKSQKP